jgi:hypothetical protein
VAALARMHQTAARRPAPRREALRAAALALALGCAAVAAGAAPALRPVGAQELCVTEGELKPLDGGRLSVEAPKMRAVLDRVTRPVIEARFTYSGATTHDMPLGSGAVRRQFGLKLQAQDPCNLLYVMWRIEPESGVVVSVKSNVGQHSSAECGNRGYSNLKPQRTAAVPALRPGEAHALRAVLDGEVLRVYADEAAVWQGHVGPAALLDGPVGMRSDNARLTLALRAGQPLEGPRGEPRACAVPGASPPRGGPSRDSEQRPP